MSVLAYRDLVPADLRAAWTTDGLYPGRDVFSLFAAHAAANPSRAAVIDDDRIVDYATLHMASLRVAATLAEAGLRRGEVVAIQLSNGWRACAVELAVAAAGAIALSYPVGRGERDTRALLGRSGAAVAVLDAADGDLDAPGAVTALGRNGELPQLRDVFVVGKASRACASLDAALEGHGSVSWSPTEAIDPDGPVRILVSSGSEGEPKMVLYSHNALTGGRGALMGSLRANGEPLRSLFLVPLGSSFGSNAMPVTLARHGGTLLLQRRFDAAGALALIDEHQPTHLLGVGAMYQRLLAHERSGSIDTRSLRALVAGGSRVDRATVEACRERFGCAFVNLYGSADGVACLTDPADTPRMTSESVGRPNPAVTTIRVVDEDGDDLPAGHEGEILSRGPMSPLCYVNCPVLDDRYRTATGWVRTGDRGRFDETGRLFVVGRLKEIIVRGGLNVSPVEIEQLLHLHPAVAQVACIGVPDCDLGERVCACVVPRDPRCPPCLDELTAFLEAQGLERKKLPERLELLDDLPISPAGKVAKQALRRWLATARQAA